MKKERFYSIVIILLLILNLGTLGYLWTNKNEQHHLPPPMHNRPDPAERIARKLQLNDEQKEQFEVLKQEHKRGIDSVHNAMNGLRRELFMLADNKELDATLQDSLLNEIKNVEAAKHMVVLKHFHDLRLILREDQLGAFDDLIEEVSRGAGPGHHPPPPPRH